MKKIIILAFALFAVMACSEDDSRIFDKTANERIFENKKEFFDKLTNDNWIIELFPGATEEFGGFAIFADFSEDYKVNLVNEFSMKKAGTAYDVISRDGSLLTFNEYNEAMHVFSQPDIDNPKGQLKTVDYEFIYVKSVGDILYTKGVKTSNSIRFVKTDLSPEEYFNRQKDVNDFINKTGRIVTQFLVNGKALEFQFGTGGFGKIFEYTVTSMVEKDGKEVEEKELFKNAFVYTDRGIRFYTNIEGTEVFELILDKENNVLKSEDGKVELKMAVPPVNFNKELWEMDLKSDDVSPKLKAEFDVYYQKNLENKTLKKYGVNVLSSKVNLGYFVYDLTNTGKTPNTGMHFNSSGAALVCLLKFGFEFVGEDAFVKLTKASDEGVNWGVASHLEPFIALFADSSPYKIEVVEKDKKIKLVSKTNPEIWFVLTKK